MLVNLHIDMGRASASAVMAWLVYCMPALADGVLAVAIEWWICVVEPFAGCSLERQYLLMYALGHSFGLLESTRHNEKTGLS